jgi:hypothetical protein
MTINHLFLNFSPGSQVLNLNLNPRESIAFQFNAFCILSDANSGMLKTPFAVLKPAVTYCNITGLVLNIDSQSWPCISVIPNNTSINKVSVAGAVFIGFLPENYASFAIVLNNTIPYYIIGIPMTKIDSVSGITFRQAIFRNAVAYAPAPEKSLAIAPCGTANKDRTLRSASRMIAQVSVIYC